MSEPRPLPLAAAQARLGKPGRPRKAGSALPSQGRALLERPESQRQTRPFPASSVVVPTNVPDGGPPRVLDLYGAAAYLSLSAWTVRDLIANGTLARVRIPTPNGGELRKVLLDREDLDRLVATWKT